jgi:hypothetical protein
MKKTAKTRQHVIHFRRWSRKGYAVFCSIGRCVLIGRLGKNVAEASLKKQKAVCFWTSTEESGIDREREDEPDVPDLLRQRLSVSILPQTAIGDCGCDCYAAYNLKSTGQDAVMHPTGFFMHSGEVILHRRLQGCRDGARPVSTIAAQSETSLHKV